MDRREFFKRSAYITPAIISIAVHPAFAQSGYQAPAAFIGTEAKGKSAGKSKGNAYAKGQTK